MPWGDYGDILFKGFLNVMDEDFNDLDVPEVERAGPFIPDIYIANSLDIVVKDKIREALEHDGISGITEFRKTKLKKIVHIDWENWDENSNPKFYPKSGEPADYITRGKNDEGLFGLIPILWNLKMVKKNRLNKLSTKPDYVNYSHLQLESNLLEHEDIFTPENMLHTIVSEKFKNLMEKNSIESVRFIELQVS